MNERKSKVFWIGQQEAAPYIEPERVGEYHLLAYSGGECVGEVLTVEIVDELIDELNKTRQKIISK